MRLFSLGAVIWAMSLLACSPHELKNAAGQGTKCCVAEQSDFEIYGEILGSHIPFSRVLVREETLFSQVQPDWLTNGAGNNSVTKDPTLVQELIASYQRRNTAKISLAGLDSLKNARAISEQQLDIIFAGGSTEGYERLKQEFPDAAAVVAFSLPGYVQGKSIALVYVDIGRGPLDTQGKVLILKKLPGGKWSIVEAFTIAES